MSLTERARIDGVSPPKKKRAPAKSAPQRAAERTYELDKSAQAQFWREAHRLFCEFLRTRNEKHLRAFHKHIDGLRDWRGKQACLERVYAKTGRSKASLLYVLTQFEHIGEQSGERQGKARRPSSTKGGSR
jgi:hypothetical protein